MGGETSEPFWSLPNVDADFPQPNRFADGTIRVVSCYPTRTDGLEGAASSVTAVRQIVADLQLAHPNANFGVTGVPVLEYDEMRQSSQDMTIASIVSAIGVTTLLLLGFRGHRVPLLAVATLAVSISWAVGWAALSVGSLNILSVSFAAILIGLGVDFSLHWLAHASDAEQEIGELTTPAEIAVRAAAYCGTGIATAAVTTSTAFLVACVTPFRGLSELGVIAGGGVLLCAAAALIITPALATISRRKLGRGGTPQYAYALSRQIAANPLYIMAMTLVLVVACGFLAFDVRDGFRPRVGYESNLIKMQPEGLPSIVAQRELEAATEGGLLYGVSRRTSAAAARELQAQLTALPEVGAAWSLGNLLPETSDAKIERVRAIEAQLLTRSRPWRHQPTLPTRSPPLISLQTI